MPRLLRDLLTESSGSSGSPYTFDSSVVGVSNGVPSEYNVFARLDGKVVGKASVKVVGKSRLRCAGIGVDEAHRRRGVATGMFRHIESKLGRTLTPGKHQTPDGRALWAGSGGRFGQVLDKR